MREIKFRAWDKKRKEMLRITMMDFAEWWVSCRPPGIQAGSLEYGERNSFKSEKTDRHIIMQYTGLKDKNGKEIYEGDVVRRYIRIDDEDNIDEIFEIEWYVDDIECGWSIFPVDCDSYEVIGNIYENPELMSKD
jgi:uncharacterized phage protein (TIGR01671 family)